MRLHAILHDAAGAVWAHDGKGPCYCYIFGRGPDSCLLRHVTGQPFCLYVKLLLPSIFDCLHFCSLCHAMYYLRSWQTKTFLRSWEYLMMAKFRHTHFVLQNSANPKSKRFGEDTCMDTWICVEQWTFGLQWVCKQSSNSCKGRINLICKKNIKTQASWQFVG